jgi:CBS domain-containing protein
MERYGRDFGGRMHGRGGARHGGYDMGYGGGREGQDREPRGAMQGRGGMQAEREGGYGGSRGGMGGYGAFQGGSFGYGGGYEMGRQGGMERGYEDDFDGRERGGRQGGQPRFGDGEMSRMRAAEIMTENPETLTPDATLADAARKMRDLDVGIIPVVDGESRRLKGVITDRDIAVRAVAEGRDANSTRVSDCMSEGVETCNKNDSIRDVLQLMKREQVRRVPITDREGRLVGIIAQADLAVDFAGDDEGRQRKVARAVERISAPAEPDRGGRGGRGAMQARGGSQQQGDDQG